MPRTSVAAPSTVFALHVAMLALAFVAALEMAGVVALAHDPRPLEAVATVDGTTLQAPVAPRAARVEISIVAQADTPAR